MGDLTKNFDKKEFMCKCGCGKYNPDPKLISGLQELRDLIGEPIVITSACRCEKHNKAVGGVSNSLHLRGKAADIYVKSLTPRELAKFAKQIPVFYNGGIGIYETTKKFVHVDVRGYFARW